MNRYLITLGRKSYNDAVSYPLLKIGPEQDTIIKLFTSYFGYEHLEDLSTDELEETHTKKLGKWFLEKEGKRYLRNPDDLVVIYYTGHGDIANGMELRLVDKESTPNDLVDTGTKPLDLLKGWISSPVRHVWLILDVCHSGSVGDNISDVLKHLSASIPEDKSKGKSLHIITSCQKRQSAALLRFATALQSVFEGVVSADFQHGRLSLDDLQVCLQSHLTAVGQACERYSGGNGWQPFLSLDQWQAGVLNRNAVMPTDAALHVTDLTRVADFLATLGWPLPWLVRLLPKDRRMQACRRKFSSIAEFVRWTCELPMDEKSQLCPLLITVLRATAETPSEPEPIWLATVAAWRGANLIRCRDAADKEAREFKKHSDDYPARIKVIGRPRMDTSGSGAYTDKVDYEIWQDFEDSEGKMILPLDEWMAVSPADPEHGKYLEVYAANCGCMPSPAIQITLPLHLINEPVEDIPVQDGRDTSPIGAVYDVILTAWERDFERGFHLCRQRRGTMQYALWRGAGGAPACVILDAEKLKDIAPPPGRFGRCA